LNQLPLDWEGNARRIREAIEEARRRGVTILCLPELCITGYGCEDAFHAESTEAEAWAVLQQLLPHTAGMAVAMGIPIRHRNALYNGVAVVVDGTLRGVVAKRFLAGDGIHYEPRWFRPWPNDVRIMIERFGEQIPLGDLVMDLGDIRVGFEICEDAWVANRPGAELALLGTDVILNPSASHFAFGKAAVRRQFVVEGSRAFAATYVYANLLGNEAGRAIYDGGAIIASGGKLLVQGNRLGFQEVVVESALVDVAVTRLQQARTTSHQPDPADSKSTIVKVAWPPPAITAAASPRGAISVASVLESQEEEFSRAVALALFDYMRKSRSNGFVLSLSGGADSSAIAVLVRAMAEYALADLGPAIVAERLSYIAGVADACSSPEALVRRLLLTAYQGTRNSGEVTRSAAEVVATSVGAEHVEFDVDGLLTGYTSLAEAALGRPLEWKRDDLALQNIQARVRAPSIWMLANVRGALLVSTSNRSEAAVGYATMDGDTAGGLAPIAGIDKAFLRHWLRWMERSGPLGIGPMPALSVVNEQAPTAELRPREMAQTDEADLMPYEVLDAAEAAAIRDRKAPVDVWRSLLQHFPQFPPAQLALWVERFFRLWCRNQWKRERYAPSFHLDDENLDPKTWCRFPILSSGYEKELGDLRRLVAELR
jgi:NAD+ synthase (glutamine-hydrolysing)